MTGDEINRDSNKELRLKQMRNAQKKLREKRKDQVTELKETIEHLKEVNNCISTENIILRIEREAAAELLSTDLLYPQCQVLIKLHRNKFEMEEDAYLTIDECKEKFYYPFPLKYTDFNGSSCGLLETFAKRFNDGVQCFKKHGLRSPLKRSQFRYLPLYGINLVGNYVKQVEKYNNEGLIPKSWFYDADKMALPKGSVSFPLVVQSIIEKFDPNTQILDVLIILICGYSFATDFGPAIMAKCLQTCHELSMESKFDETYILGDLEREISADYFDNLRDELNRNKKP